MSESEYKKLVLADYDRQMEARLLSSELLVPTPANIKAEVVKICERGPELNPGDEKILRSFVGEREDAAAYRKAFQNGKADPFRQVVKLLAERSVNTNIKYINLLALLIGFPSRPYHPNLKPIGLTQAGVITDPPVKETLKPAQLSVESEAKRIKRKSYMLLWVFASVIVAGIGWYVISKRTVKHYTGLENCMIWNDDHYEPVDCNNQSPGTSPWPINHQLIDHFKKITRPDTLTLYSVGKVWYAKYNGRVEFYTAAGPYPLDSNRRVLRMSDHILKKYVYHSTN